MRISLIVAASENNVIGRDNGIPWHLPDDFKFFRQTTQGHPIIMGRKNFESIGRVLLNRRNIIVTRQEGLQIEGCDVVSSVQEAIDLASEEEKGEIFIIGGGEIYTLSMDLADRIYMTRVHANIDGDVFFPIIDLTVWQEVEKVEHPADENHEHAFTILTYDRK